MLHDSKAETCSSVGTRAALVDTVEALKHLRLRLFGDADSGIGYRYGRTTRYLIHPDVYLAIHAVVADSVVAEIRYHLIEQPRIADDHALLPFERKAHTGTLCLVLEAVRDVSCNLVEVAFCLGAQELRVARTLRLIHLGERQDVAHKRREAPGRAVDASGELRDVLGTGNAVTYQLSSALDRGNRCLELVRHVRRELEPIGVSISQLVHLGYELCLLVVQAVYQRLKLTVGSLCLGSCRIDIKYGLHEALREHAACRPGTEHDERDNRDKKADIVREDRCHGLPVLREPQDVARAKPLRVVERDIACGIGGALGLPGARRQSLLDLLSVCVVRQARSLELCVVDDRAVRSDERRPHLLRCQHAHDILIRIGRIVRIERCRYCCALVCQLMLCIVDERRMEDKSRRKRGHDSHAHGEHCERSEDDAGKRSGLMLLSHAIPSDGTPRL